jgi:hypothetical protein
VLGLGWQELVMLVVVIALIASFFGIGSLGGRSLPPLEHAREPRDAPPRVPVALPQLTATAARSAPEPAPRRSVERPENV